MVGLGACRSASPESSGAARSLSAAPSPGPAGRFAGHALYPPVGPVYPGSTPIKDTFQEVFVADGCPRDVSTYGTSDSPLEVRDFYRRQGLHEGDGARHLVRHSFTIEAGDDGWVTVIVVRRLDCTDFMGGG